MSTLAALRLIEGDPDGEGTAVWEPSFDRDLILELPHSHVILLPESVPLVYERYRRTAKEMRACFATGSGDDGWRRVQEFGEGEFCLDVSAIRQEDVLAELSRRYPAEHPQLPARCKLESTNMQVRVQEPPREAKPDYCSPPSCQRLTTVTVRSRMHVRYVSDALGVPVLAELARTFGHIRLKYCPTRNQTVDLREEGCLVRSRAPRSAHEQNLLQYGRAAKIYEVWYAPQKTATILKRLEHSPARDESRASLTTDKMFRPLRAVRELLQQFGDQKDYTRHGRIDRTFCVTAWFQLIDRFNEIYGRNAHRQLPELQVFFKKTWPKCADRTRRNWGSVHSYSYEYRADRLFDWFDQEAKARKPKPRNLAAVVESRTRGLFEIPEKAAAQTA
jgi:hypothetical protein